MLTISPIRFQEIRRKVIETRLARQSEPLLEGRSDEQRFKDIEALMTRLDQLTDEAE